MPGATGASAPADDRSCGPLLRRSGSGVSSGRGIVLTLDQYASVTRPRKGAPHTWALVFFVVFLLWIGTFHAARLLEYAPFASLWFPPSAVTFAAFAVLRWRALPGLLAAACAASWSTWARQDVAYDAHDVLLNAALFSAAHCVPFWLAAEAVLRSISAPTSPSIVRTVAVFLLSGMAAAALAALGGVFATVDVGLASEAERWPLVLPWLIGDYVGLLVSGPLVLLALRWLAAELRLPVAQHLYAFDGIPRPPRSLRSFLMKLGGTLGVAVLALVAVAKAPSNEPLLFLVSAAIVMQLWIVHTQGALEALVSIALFSLTVVVSVAALDLAPIALDLQLAIITQAAASYFALTVPVLYADNALLRRRLIRDALTGAYSRHFFVDLSQQAIAQAHERGEPVSLLMIDLDHLKNVNDRHGHAAGDRALVQMTDLCHAALGPKDLLGRLGGDEFCALLPGQDAESAAAVAASLIAAVHASRFAFADDVRPSLSIGLATTQSPDDDYESLWLRADSALYVAKRSGRGRMARDTVD